MIETVTTGELAEALSAELIGRDDLVLDRLETLDVAGEGALSFVRDDRFAALWERSGASAALVSAGVTVQGHDPETRALLIVQDADLALVKILELIAQRKPRAEAGVHEGACVHETAQVAPSASIGAGVVIGARARVGEACVIHPNAVIEDDVVVGDGCEIRACVVIGRGCTIGDGCILHTGVSIGTDGFGYRPAPDGNGLIKIPHVGNVVIGRGVEIGANSCVDRAKFGSTTIGDGTKIDNLVQVAHNCKIGRACVLCGNAGLAGSVTLGDGVMIGGGTSISDGLTLGDGVQVGGGSGVMNDIGAGEKWIGNPATPRREQVRLIAEQRRIVRAKGTGRSGGS